MTRRTPPRGECPPDPRRIEDRLESLAGAFEAAANDPAAATVREGRLAIVEARFNVMVLDATCVRLARILGYSAERLNHVIAEEHSHVINATVDIAEATLKAREGGYHS
jgi:hypothetical protein